jgi:Site-specific recombinase XerD
VRFVKARTSAPSALPEAKHRLRFHDLRHTCASLLIAAGAHPKAIQEHLGHRDIQTTFNVYGHLLPSAREALAAALDTAYEGGSGPEPTGIQRRGRYAAPVEASNAG